jgi:hypothetical protein
MPVWTLDLYHFVVFPHDGLNGKVFHYKSRTITCIILIYNMFSVGIWFCATTKVPDIGHVIC